jgi:hypothetical protein
MEKVRFHIVLKGEYQTHPPHAKVTIANNTVFDSTVTSESFVFYNAKLENDKDYQLKIELLDKKPEHTVIDDQGNISKDSLLKIEKITIEDIEIQNNLSLDQEKFYYECAGKKNILYNTLGENGTAVINFSTPFYKWLLETI